MTASKKASQAEARGHSCSLSKNSCTDESVFAHHERLDGSGEALAEYPTHRNAGNSRSGEGFPDGWRFYAS